MSQPTRRRKADEISRDEEEAEGSAWGFFNSFNPWSTVKKRRVDSGRDSTGSSTSPSVSRLVDSFQTTSPPFASPVAESEDATTVNGHLPSRESAASIGTAAAVPETATAPVPLATSMTSGLSPVPRQPTANGAKTTRKSPWKAAPSFSLPAGPSSSALAPAPLRRTHFRPQSHLAVHRRHSRREAQRDGRAASIVRRIQQSLDAQEALTTGPTHRLLTQDSRTFDSVRVGNRQLGTNQTGSRLASVSTSIPALATASSSTPEQANKKSKTVQFDQSHTPHVSRTSARGRQGTPMPPSAMPPHVYPRPPPSRDYPAQGPYQVSDDPSVDLVSRQVTMVSTHSISLPFPPVQQLEELGRDALPESEFYMEPREYEERGEEEDDDDDVGDFELDEAAASEMITDKSRIRVNSEGWGGTAVATLMKKREVEWNCPFCFTYNPNSEVRCYSCEAWKCPKCDTLNEEKADSCKKCGNTDQPAKIVKIVVADEADAESKNSSSGGVGAISSTGFSFVGAATSGSNTTASSKGGGFSFGDTQFGTAPKTDDGKSSGFSFAGAPATGGGGTGGFQFGGAPKANGKSVGFSFGQKTDDENKKDSAPTTKAVSFSNMTPPKDGSEKKEPAPKTPFAPTAPEASVPFANATPTRNDEPKKAAPKTPFAFAPPETPKPAGDSKPLSGPFAKSGASAPAVTFGVQKPPLEEKASALGPTGDHAISAAQSGGDSAAVGASAPAFTFSPAGSSSKVTLPKEEGSNKKKRRGPADGEASAAPIAVSAPAPAPRTPALAVGSGSAGTGVGATASSGLFGAPAVPQESKAPGTTGPAFSFQGPSVEATSAPSTSNLPLTSGPGTEKKEDSSVAPPQSVPAPAFTFGQSSDSKAAPAPFATGQLGASTDMTSTPAPAAPFVFGATANNGPPTTGTSGFANPFGSAPATTPAPDSAAPAVPAFASAPATATPVFGVADPATAMTFGAPTAPAFGSTPSTAPTGTGMPGIAPTAPAFGAVSAAPSFGGQEAAPAGFGQSGFFAGNGATGPAQGAMFGAPASVAPSASSSSFAFGATTPAGSTPAPGGFPFGAAQPSATPGGFGAVMPNAAPLQAQTPGGFSIGTGGGSKSVRGRRIVRARRPPTTR